MKMRNKAIRLASVCAPLATEAVSAAMRLKIRFAPWGSVLSPRKDRRQADIKSITDVHRRFFPCGNRKYGMNGLWMIDND
jgi:hypothetical protein